MFSMPFAPYFTHLHGFITKPSTSSGVKLLQLFCFCSFLSDFCLDFGMMSTVSRVTIMTVHILEYSSAIAWDVRVMCA